MGLFKNIKVKFADFWHKPLEYDLSKQRVSTRPAKRQMDGGLAANEILLKGIYTGSGQNLALASYLSSGMVDVPKNMVGIPGVIPDQGQDARSIKELMSLVVDEFPVTVTEMLTLGTAWRWARWSDKLHRLTWEVIPDSSITSIIIDLDTGEISELYIDEQIDYNEGETNIANVNRKRHITRTLITETWKGKINKTVQYKNPFGFMPIPFGHNCFSGEWRGNSVFARVLRWMKSLHDIAYKRDSILADFEPKIIQQVKSPKTWMENNTTGIGNNDLEIDPFGRKLFLNMEGESTQFISLSSDATAQHTVAIKDIELKIIKGSGIPELFFGALATGNHASTEADKLLALEHIKSIRRELTKGAQKLIYQSLKILAFMRFTEPPQFTIQWGNLSLLSETQKAQIMGAYASAIVPLLGNGVISKEGIFWLTKGLYPDFPVEDAEHFMNGINEMTKDFVSKSKKE
jgi:hypothetical protein